MVLNGRRKGCASSTAQWKAAREPEETEEWADLGLGKERVGGRDRGERVVDHSGRVHSRTQ